MTKHEIKFFKPTDFLDRDLRKLRAEHGLAPAIAIRANDILKRKGQLQNWSWKLIGGCPACEGEATHRALVIPLSLIEKCKHEVEWFVPSGSDAPKFRCKNCDAPMKITGFEEIK